MATTVSCNMAAMLLQQREMHPRFVVEVCHLFFAGFSKKRKQTIAEVELTFCTEAKKEIEQKARITRREREPWGSPGEVGKTVLNNVMNYSESIAGDGR